MTAEIGEALLFVYRLRAGEEAEGEGWNGIIHNQKNPIPVATAELFPINFPRGRIFLIVPHLLGQPHKQQTNEKKTQQTSLELLQFILFPKLLV